MGIRVSNEKENLTIAFGTVLSTKSLQKRLNYKCSLI